MVECLQKVMMWDVLRLTQTLWGPALGTLPRPDPPRPSLHLISIVNEAKNWGLCHASDAYCLPERAVVAVCSHSLRCVPGCYWDQGLAHTKPLAGTGTESFDLAA